MLTPIIGYHLDDENHWVARLACGHFQHVRHQPPFINRPWVLKQSTRDEKLGKKLNCISYEKRQIVINGIMNY